MLRDRFFGTVSVGSFVAVAQYIAVAVLLASLFLALNRPFRGFRARCRRISSLWTSHGSSPLSFWPQRFGTTRTGQRSRHCLAVLARFRSLGNLLLAAHSHSSAFQSPCLTARHRITNPAAKELPRLVQRFFSSVTSLEGYKPSDLRGMFCP